MPNRIEATKLARNMYIRQVSQFEKGDVENTAYIDMRYFNKANVRQRGARNRVIIKMPRYARLKVIGL